MDISAATTFAAGIVALVAPALVQAFKKYIPADYVGLTPLGVSILLGVIAIAATNNMPTANEIHVSVGANGMFNHASAAAAANNTSITHNNTR